MSRYEAMFARLREEGRIAFVPFMVVGFPREPDFIRIVELLVSNGADALELGIPFSDPLADGPTIQRAMETARISGATPDMCFQLLGEMRRRYPNLPIGLLVYANLVWAQGLEHFFGDCAAAGVDSVLIADVPIEEARKFLDAANAKNIGLVFLCPPNIDAERLKAIAAAGSGYTYLLSRAGVTGAESAPGRPVRDIIEQLKILGAPPGLLGFGISRPEHVTAAIQSGAAGVICGSALIDKVLSASGRPEIVDQNVTELCRTMIAATRIR